MNNYESTEKSLKRWLKTKVKVTIATVVGFLIAGTVVMGADATDKVTWEKVDGTYTNKIIDDLATSKFVVGKDGKLVIDTHGSAGELLADLIASNGDFEKIRSALSQNAKVVDGQYVNKYKDEQNQGKTVITGAIAGEGKLNTVPGTLINLLANNSSDNSNITKLAKALNRINTLGKKNATDGDKTESKSTTTVIGDKNSPVVIGLVGGDFALGTGNLLEISGSSAEELIINKDGSSTVTINNGNVFLGSAGSASVSLGNMSVYRNKDELGKINGSSETTINENTELNINGGANAAGITAGGLAAAIGGTSTSTVTGSSTINVNSVVDDEELEGITAGLFGGGMAVSTLGGTASANTNGTTNVKITDGLSVGVAGGGLAVATDLSQYIKDKEFKIGEREVSIKVEGNQATIKSGSISAVLNGLYQGGTSTVTSGNINVALNGKTSAAGVLGNGIAVSHQNSADGTVSKSTVTAGNTNIKVEVDDSTLTKDDVGNIIGALKELKKEDLKNNTIETLKKITGTVANKGVVVGVAGNGVAVARDKGVSNVTAGNTVIDLKDGYVVGVAGNGIASGNASSKVTANSSTITIDGAEVIGVTGSGIALDHGVVDDKAYSKSEIGTTTINLNSGSADGIFGGGVAITKAHKDSKAEVTTEKSTITVENGSANRFGYQHISDIFGKHGSFDKIAELGKDVAIVGGGVASRNGVTTVGESVINIKGGTVNGDILAGGIAVSGGKSEVTKSTINIKGGNIDGSVYGYGLASKEVNGGVNIVDRAGEATVGESYLNIDGYQNSIKRIAGFKEINIGMNKAKSSEIDKYNTQLTIIDGIDVGTGKLTNAGAIIFANEKENSALMTVTEGGSALNEGLIVVDFGDKVADGNGYVKNTGKIKIADKSLEDLKNDSQNFAIKDLFGNNYTHIGMIVDVNGDALLLDEENIASGTLTTEDINKANPDGDRNVTLSSAEITTDGTINLETVNVAGNVEANANITFDKTKLNFDNAGNIEIADGKTLTVSNTIVNGSEEADIKFEGEQSKLVISNTTIDQGVIGEDTKKGIVDFKGTNNRFNGTIKAKAINIREGNAVAFGEGAVGAGTITLDGDATIAVGKENTNGVYTQNFFHNSNGDIKVQGKGNIIIGTENFTGEKVTVDFGTDNEFSSDLTNKLNTTTIYMIKEGEDLTDGQLELVYNDKLYEDTPELNDINSAAKVVNQKFSNDPAVRKIEIDKHYSSNIYSETVRAAYDNVKMNEEAVESLAGKSQVGKWTAEGKALYAKNEYDRKGIVKDYSSEVESTGLMAAFGYGVSETTTAGVAFSGVKQDVDTDNGSADADLFYLGVYGNKVVGNYDFTAGLGYQFGEYDADNNILGTTGDKYDTQALSGYVQGRYTADLGDGLSVQPKVKLGYTYIDQDNAKDSYFGVSDAEISTFDAEVGFDVVKSVQFEKSQADVKFGLSYTKAMGDTDKEFTGRFYGKEASNGFNVLGAELAENTVKFDLGTEVTNENGFFYNGGFTYEFGSNDTEAYGVNVGVGYKF